MKVFLILLGLVVVLGISIVIVLAITEPKRNARCKKCKTFYETEDIEVWLSDLKWRKETEHKTSREDIGDVTLYSSSDHSYKIYYYWVEIHCICPNCGTEKIIERRYDVYRSDSNHSINSRDIYIVLQKRLHKEFGKYIDKNKEIILHFQDSE